MPDQGPRVLYRLRNHIAGVNWRPTRFAEAMPTYRICGICHTIPKKTLALPCAHFICESCHRACAQDGGGVCPLDGVTFADDECGWDHFVNSKSKRLRAHCWNEAHGCAFVGTMDIMLRHYETECPFHTVECPQCGDAVLHNQLAGHYMAGCIGGTPSTAGDAESRLIVHDVRAAVEELKAMVRNPLQDQLPALQSQMNTLIEGSRNDTANLLETVRSLTEYADSIKDDVMQIAGNVATTLAEVQRYRIDFVENRCGVIGASVPAASIPWHTEQKLILRRLEKLAEQSLIGIEQLRESTAMDTGLALISTTADTELVPIPETSPEPPTTFRLRDTKQLSSAALCGEKVYLLGLKNVRHLLPSLSRRAAVTKRATLIIWDFRDGYLKVTLTITSRELLPLTCPVAILDVRLEFCCLIPSSRSSSVRYTVRILHKEPWKSLDLNLWDELRNSGHLLFYFGGSLELPDFEGFLHDGEFRLELKQQVL
ncbi:uncharacterized protein LOC144107093 [Amblyomma americanum]